MTQVASPGEVSSSARHLLEHGYAVLPSVLDEPSVTLLRRLRDRVVDDWQYTCGLTITPDAVGGMLERAPRVILPIVAHPVLLGFAEAVIGPVVQLDSAVLAGDPPSQGAVVDGPAMWHRDRFGSVPPTGYVKPASVVFIAYLQDMTPEMGQTPGPPRLAPPTGPDRCGRSAP